jgi:hypothetical protein
MTVQTDGEDLVLGGAKTWGLGFNLSETGKMLELSGRKLAVGAGAGGSLLTNDPERATTFAYTMNKMEPGLGVGNKNSIAYYKILEAIQSRKDGVGAR